MKIKNIITSIIVSLSIIGISGCDEQKANLKEVKIGYLPSPGHLLYFIGVEEGFFKEEGIDPKLVLFNENNSELAALESGKIDVGAFGSTELVSYSSEGHEITTFAGAMKSGHGIIVKDKIVDGIPKDKWSLELLKGKRIGVETFDSAHIVVREALKKLGIEDTTEFVIFQDGSDVYASLKNDDIDAAILYSPYRILAENEGYNILINSGDVEGFIDHVCCRQAVLTKTLKDDTDTYKHFIRALIKAYKFYKTNKSKSVDDIAIYVDVEKELLEKDTYNYDREIANPDPEVKSMKDFYDALVDLGFLKQFDLDKYLDSSIYEQALDEIIKENPNDKIYKELKQYHQK